MGRKWVSGLLYAPGPIWCRGWSDPIARWSLVVVPVELQCEVKLYRIRLVKSYFTEITVTKLF